jgi:hypothetical protein
MAHLEDSKVDLGDTRGLGRGLGNTRDDLGGGGASAREEAAQSGDLVNGGEKGGIVSMANACKKPLWFCGQEKITHGGGGARAGGQEGDGGEVASENAGGDSNAGQLGKGDE